MKSHGSPLGMQCCIGLGFDAWHNAWRDLAYMNELRNGAILHRNNASILQLAVALEKFSSLDAMSGSEVFLIFTGVDVEGWVSGITVWTDDIMQ